MGRFFGHRMILLEGAVHYRASNLEHQMCPTWRPPHLLLRVHPAMQEPLYRTSVVAVEIGSLRRRAVA
jgi:hypothetical protein